LPLFASEGDELRAAVAFPRLSPTVDSIAEELVMDPKYPTPDATTTLSIEARDLDTDAREQAAIDAVAPVDPREQAAALAEAVARLFPRATLRSFADGAATFLDPQHLIVASYAEVPRMERRERQADAEREEQNQLFAA
jgi:hypothetical protein